MKNSLVLLLFLCTTCFAREAVTFVPERNSSNTITKDHSFSLPGTPAKSETNCDATGTHVTCDTTSAPATPPSTVQWQTKKAYVWVIGDIVTKNGQHRHVILRSKKKFELYEGETYDGELTGWTLWLYTGDGKLKFEIYH